ncbi:unnamed protein product [Cyprideis torosa]|uniref:Uncharacterized protein n=1 Tax=Cyprideis torosa TaxID=163714 RepID=A0A7R8WC07_9CRUS|nr:unnamed protein product [Cyprideis torosa]CAG0887030.1 unnamed protein product [Cyprideis torosa]
MPCPFLGYTLDLLSRYVLAATSDLAKDDPLCEFNGDGNFQNPEDCSTYFNCTDGNLSLEAWSLTRRLAPVMTQRLRNAKNRVGRERRRLDPPQRPPPQRPHVQHGAEHRTSQSDLRHPLSPGPPLGQPHGPHPPPLVEDIFQLATKSANCSLIHATVRLSTNVTERFIQFSWNALMVLSSMQNTRDASTQTMPTAKSSRAVSSKKLNVFSRRKMPSPKSNIISRSEETIPQAKHILKKKETIPQAKHILKKKETIPQAKHILKKKETIPQAKHILKKKETIPQSAVPLIMQHFHKKSEEQKFKKRHQTTNPDYRTLLRDKIALKEALERKSQRQRAEQLLETLGELRHNPKLQQAVARDYYISPETLKRTNEHYAHKKQHN